MIIANAGNVMVSIVGRQGLAAHAKDSRVPAEEAYPAPPQDITEALGQLAKGIHSIKIIVVGHCSDPIDPSIQAVGRSGWIIAGESQARRRTA